MRRNPVAGLALGLLLAAPAAAELPLEDLREVEVSGKAVPGLSSTVRSALDEFLEAREGYGSFFVSRSGRDFGYVTGVFTQADAALVARVLCEAGRVEDCIGLAKVRPAEPDGGIGVPRRFWDRLNAIFLETERGGWLAIAAMPVGAFGYGTHSSSRPVAERSALDECAKLVEGERAVDPKEVRAALDAEGGYRCRILATLRR